MTPLPIPTDRAAPESIDPNKWIPIDEAADRLGLNVRHLARKCKRKLEAMHLAIKATSPDGASPRWYIARRYNLCLARGAAGQSQVAPDLEQFPEHKTQPMYERAACVKAYRSERRRARSPKAQWLPALLDRLQREYPHLSISARSLDRWHRLYSTPADIVKLVDQRGGNQRGDADPAAWDHFRTIYCDPRQPSKRSCWERTRDYARAEGLTWCSYSQCLRRIDDKIPPAVATRHRDEDLFKQRFQPYIEQHPESWAAGECWIGDHCQLDLACRFGDAIIRPWLTTWMDWRTRRITGWTLTDSPNSSTILAALRSGIMDERNVTPPERVWIDNGKDYESYVFHGRTKSQRKRGVHPNVNEDKTEGLLGLLQIEAHFSLPYNPNGKSRLERWFGTLHDQHDRTYETYTGRDPQHRPKHLTSILKQPHRVPTFEHVRDRLADYIAGYNASREHSKSDLEGMSPDEAMAQWCTRNRVFADPSVLDQLLMHWHKPVSVHRNGVSIKPFGKTLSYGQFDQELLRFKRLRKDNRELVRVSYDPQDLRYVRIYTMDWRFVCMSSLNRVGGNGGVAVSQGHVKDAIREQRRYRSAKQIAARGFKHEYTSAAEVAAQSARADDRRDRQPDPVTLKLVETPIDGESKAVQKRVDQASNPRPLPALPDLMELIDDPFDRPIQRDKLDAIDLLELHTFDGDDDGDAAGEVA